MATRKKKGSTIFSATGREETVETMKKELEDEQKAKVTDCLSREGGKKVGSESSNGINRSLNLKLLLCFSLQIKEHL